MRNLGGRIAPGSGFARAIFVVLLVFQPACFFGLIGGSAKTAAPAASVTPDTQTKQNVPTPLNAYQDVLFTYTPSSSISGTWSAQGLPSWATLNTSTGALTGYPDAPGNATVTLTVTPNSGTAATTVIGITVAGDPLTTFTWHLNNTGQSSFSSGKGTAGQDMGVRAAIGAGFTGKGVRVAVSDTGVEIAHEDLQGNVTAGMSRDYSTPPTNNQYSGDPTPSAANIVVDDNAHGTAVAGIVAAEGWNGIGGRGVAPKANLVGFNFLLNQSVTGVILDQITSYESAGNGVIDIFNQSWGSDDFAYIPISSEDPNYQARLQTGTTTYRAGKGANYVRAAGNGWLAIQTRADNSLVGLIDESMDKSAGMFLTQNSNSQGDNVVPYTLVVAALNAQGVRAEYSSAGSANWVSGLGGEYGDTAPAIVTTDISGCTNGFSHDTSKDYANTGTLMPINSFEYDATAGSPQQQNNANCNYTSAMNGTSSATPSVAGVVALMLEANPNLTWRDVFTILASTATEIDTSISLYNSTSNTSMVVGSATYTNDTPDHGVQPLWTKNAAGYHFHNWYGFGRANASAAVTMAKTYTPTVATLQDTLTTSNLVTKKLPAGVAIPDDAPLAGINEPMTVSITGNPKIFTAQVTVTSNHPLPAELSITLTSPSGTKSVILNSYNSFVGNTTTTVIPGTTLAGAVFRTNAFLGEATNGKWTLTVADVDNLNLSLVETSPNSGVFTLLNSATPKVNTGSLASWSLDLYY